MKVRWSRRIREIVRQQVEELWFGSVNNAQTLKRGGQHTVEAECRDAEQPPDLSLDSSLQQRSCERDSRENTRWKSRVPDEVLCMFVR